MLDSGFCLAWGSCEPGGLFTLPRWPAAFRQPGSNMPISDARVLWQRLCDSSSDTPPAGYRDRYPWVPLGVNSLLSVFKERVLLICSGKLPGPTAGLSCCAGLTLRCESIYTQDIRLGLWRMMVREIGTCFQVWRIVDSNILSLNGCRLVSPFTYINVARRAKN